MAFEHTFRLSVHAVITDRRGRVLLLKEEYGGRLWGLPGGALDPGENALEALRRECLEELGCEVMVGRCTGAYHHPGVNAHSIVVRCELPEGQEIALSAEHSEYRYFAPAELPPEQRRRVLDCLEADGAFRGATLNP